MNQQQWRKNLLIKFHQHLAQFQILLLEIEQTPNKISGPHWYRDKDPALGDLDDLEEVDPAKEKATVSSAV